MSKKKREALEALKVQKAFVLEMLMKSDSLSEQTPEYQEYFSNLAIKDLLDTWEEVVVLNIRAQVNKELEREYKSKLKRERIRQTGYYLYFGILVAIIIGLFVNHITHGITQYTTMWTWLMIALLFAAVVLILYCINFQIKKREAELDIDSE